MDKPLTATKIAESLEPLRLSCAELDRRLFDTLTRPIMNKIRQIQSGESPCDPHSSR